MNAKLRDQSEHPKKYLGVENTRIARGAIFVAVLVGVIFIWGIGDALNLPVSESAPTLSLAGFLLTGGAFVVALLIFQVQAQDSRDRASAASTQLADVRMDLLERMAHATTAADIEGDLATIATTAADDRFGEPDATSSVKSTTATLLSERLRELGVPEEKLAGIEPFEGSDIPLRPLSILRQGLSLNSDYSRVVEGSPDQLKPKDLAAYRRVGVKGPSTWFLVVPTAPGSGRGADGRRGRSIWKVSLISEKIERLDAPN